MKNVFSSIPRREMMSAQQDLNGDGIPDGAEVNVRHTAPDSKTGGATVTNVKWTKKTPTERLPMDPVPQQPENDLPPAPAPVPASEQIPTESPAPAGGSPWDQFKRRDARAGDRLLGPGRRTDTDVIPERMDDTMAFLAKRESDLSVSPTVREAASRRLAMMDSRTNRAMDLASGERTALFEAKAQKAKAQALVDSRTIPAEINAAGKATTETIRGQNKTAAEEIKTRRDLEIQRLKNDANITVANTYALMGRDKAEISAETDRSVAELNRQGKVESARLLANAKGKIDPNVWMTATEDERKQLLDMAKGKISDDPIQETPQAKTVTPAAKSTEDKSAEALRWARANPNDPRSANILKKLGIQ